MIDTTTEIKKLIAERLTIDEYGNIIFGAPPRHYPPASKDKYDYLKDRMKYLEVIGLVKKYAPEKLI